MAQGTVGCVTQWERKSFVNDNWPCYRLTDAIACCYTDCVSLREEESIARRP